MTGVGQFKTQEEPSKSRRQKGHQLVRNRAQSITITKGVEEGDPLNPINLNPLLGRNKVPT